MRRPLRKAALASILFAGTLLAVAVTVEAQQPNKVARIGYLTAQSAVPEQRRLEAFRQGLRALGYIEGQNLVIEFRHTDGKFEQLPEVAAELVRLKVDVIVANTTNAALAAKNATGRFPSFSLAYLILLRLGWVDSLARPGGNITGLTNIAPILAGKRLELLKETVPGLSRVALMWNPQNPGSVAQWQESRLPARRLGIQLHSMEVSSADKYESAFKEAIEARSAALAVTLDPLANSNQKRVVDLAAKNRLPAIYARGDYVDSGGLMSYAPPFAADGRDSARLVEKILKGAKPADLSSSRRSLNSSSTSR